MARANRARSFLDDYTRDLTTADLQRMFTRDTAEAYRYFTKGADRRRLDAQPWYRRWPVKVRLVFAGFTMRLSPARRALYGAAVVAAALGAIMLFQGIESQRVFLFPFTIYLPLPQWVDGTIWLLLAFLAINLLILMEVADRLSLKGDLEIARDIQLAMLPGGHRHAGDATVCGVTRPANTVGGDFFDVIALPDGRLVVAVGDVSGKGSPAALLMALLLAMLRTLVDEGLESARLIERLNAQVAKHSPASRFITLFYGLYDPRTGELRYVNAGHLPPVIRRNDGTFEQITGATGSGLALGMFDEATYESNVVMLRPGDLVIMYTDGITEAENPAGRPFDEAGLERVLGQTWMHDPLEIGRKLVEAVEQFADDVRLADDLTALVLKRAAPAASV